MKIGVTGHRPNKLYGYDLSDIRYTRLKNTFKKLLRDYKCTEAICGMALGADMVFALAVLELKDEGFNIKLHCAIPCSNHGNNWNFNDYKIYKNILSRADIVKVVTNEPYNKSPWMMQKRNEYMVDILEKLIAVWDGTKGGTYNCIEYCLKKNKPVIRINPK